MEDSLAGWARQRLAELDARGLLRRPFALQPPTGPRVRTPEGRTLRLFCSNDYLGLAAHPALREALAEGARRFGAGSGASRLVSGQTTEHERAEAALAELVDLPAALLFSSGYAANASCIPALVGRGDLVFSDRLVHASLIDGCRLSRATVHVYEHGAADHLAELLRRHRSDGARALVVTDSLFSMDGDLAPLAALRRLCDEHDAWLYVDEAHALGVLGPEGGGLCRREGVRPDVLIGTLGKALGLWGAFAAASAPVVRWLWQRARGFVFSTAVPPALAFAVPEAVRLGRAAEAERSRLLELAERLRTGLRRLGEQVPDGQGAVVPVLMGGPRATMARSEALAEAGCFVQGIRPPTVPPGSSRLRVTLSAAHEPADVRALLDAFAASRPLHDGR